MAHGLFVVFAVTALICASIAEEKECGANEDKLSCGPRCELRCNAPRPRNCEGLKCEPQFSCACKNGYARNPETQKCVAIEECPVNECNVGEIKIADPKTCEGICSEPFDPSKCPIIRFEREYCRCDLNGGFVRDVSGRCVRREDCFVSNQKLSKVFGTVPSVP